MKECLLVGAGGFMGSLARYGLTVFAHSLAVSPLIGIFTANALGSLLIGFIMALSKGDAYLFAAVGFCGGFTTFSTFSAQVLEQFRNGHYSMAFIYVFASVAICVLSVAAGLYIGKCVKS